MERSKFLNNNFSFSILLGWMSYANNTIQLQFSFPISFFLFLLIFFRLPPQHHWIRSSLTTDISFFWCLNLPLFFSDNDFLICRKIEANWNLSKLKQIHIKICSTNKLIVHLWFQSTLTVWKTHIIIKRISTEWENDSVGDAWNQH